MLYFYFKWLVFYIVLVLLYEKPKNGDKGTKKRSSKQAYYGFFSLKERFVNSAFQNSTTLSEIL